eukprot:3482798-Prymnesium_polylepis.1
MYSVARQNATGLSSSTASRPLWSCAAGAGFASSGGTDVRPAPRGVAARCARSVSIPAAMTWLNLWQGRGVAMRGGGGRALLARTKGCRRWLSRAGKGASDLPARQGPPTTASPRASLAACLSRPSARSSLAVYTPDAAARDGAANERPVRQRVPAAQAAAPRVAPHPQNRHLLHVDDHALCVSRHTERSERCRLCSQ